MARLRQWPALRIGIPSRWHESKREFQARNLK